VRWLNLFDVSNFRKPSMDFEIDNKVSLSVKPVYLRFTPKVHKRVRNSSIFRKCLRLCTRITKNQSLTDSGLTLDRMVWIRAPDHKDMSPNPETEDLTEDTSLKYNSLNIPFKISNSENLIV